MKSFYLLLSALYCISKFCDTNVDANGVVTWSGTSIPSNAFYGCDKIKSDINRCYIHRWLCISECRSC